MKFLLLILLLAQESFAQKLKKADRETLNNLKAHITFLADDKLEGRSTGSHGEMVAYTYLADQFKAIGLSPKGNDGTYIQRFTFTDGREINAATHFIINGHDLKIHTDFFPLEFSADKSLEAAPVMAFQEKGMPWFLDIASPLTENSNNPHFDINQYLHEKSTELGNKGASALIIYNSSELPDGIQFLGSQKPEPVAIPVIYVNKAAREKHFLDTSAVLDIKLKTDIRDKIRSGHNVIGFLDNGAANTIVIGAHYDHLGYGDDLNSLWKEAAIHNGADDNASGTAGVIELARLIRKHNFKKNNYLFICFSGEELGLFGSKYFTEKPTIDISKVDYMINLDMIGRLSDSARSVWIGGYGTSPEWGKILPVKDRSFSIKFDSSGVGPSDHTSFYRKDIPVLFFFTGLHSDYHKPSDDVAKINFLGTLNIVKYVYRIIEQTDHAGKIAFTRTRELQMGAPARFSVTLGIMPDYAFTGNGVRADGIVEGKVAQKAGIKAGDIITALDDNKAYDLTSYMKALSKYKKGDAAKVKVVRGAEELTFDIIF